MEDQKREVTINDQGALTAPAVSPGPEITPEDLDVFTLFGLPVIAHPFVPEGKIYVNPADLIKKPRR